MDSFAERLKSTFATLVRPLTPEDSQSESSISDSETRLGSWLPAVLRDYYLLAGRFDRFNRAHNELRRPEEWSVDGGKMYVGGRTERGFDLIKSELEAAGGELDYF